MRKRRSALLGAEELEINMTPMIDIVFQLLIFFVLTAKFIEHEGDLRSYLPKDRGTSASQPKIENLDVIIFLLWDGDAETGHCLAGTNKYHAPDGSVLNRYKFQIVEQPTPGRWLNVNRDESYYRHPNFEEIREYLANRQATAHSLKADFPVTINFEDNVPVQMVINMIDICTELGITDFSINAKGLE
jgi:biopolymer transport protein ExbD